MPAVDVALPVFNGESHLRQTLDSLLLQDHRELRVLVFDNASTDSTEQIVHDVMRRDQRVVYRRHGANLGAVANFNLAIAAAAAPYVMWASAHDSYAPGYISACLDELERRPQAVLCYSEAEWIDVAGRPLGKVPAALDTRDLDAASRLDLTLRQFGSYNYAIYGLMRREKLLELRSWPLPYPATLAPDHLMLAEMALLGEVLLVRIPLFSLRRMDDFMEFEAYIDKLHLGARTRTGAVRTIGRLVVRFATVSWPYPLSMRDKAVATWRGLVVGVSQHKGIVRKLWSQGAKGRA